MPFSDSPPRPVAVPWGAGELELGLPPGWPVFVAQPPPAEAAKQTPDKLLADAFAEPTDSPPLAALARKAAAGGGRIAIVVDDDTRPTPADKVLPAVLAQLGAGSLIDDSRIEIHFAGGTHTPMTREKMARKIGPGPANRFACFNNPFDKPGEYAFLGRTRCHTPVFLSQRVAEASLRVLVGSVHAHLQAGFSGGLKLLFPGLASRETIRKLHLLGTEELTPLIGLEANDNPMRREIDRMGEFLDGTTFAVQLLLDGHETPLAASAGEPVAAQRALARQAKDRFAVPMPAPADLLIANSFPLEYDLWQGFKCIANTLFAARPGGVIVAMMKADHGANEMKLPKWTVSRKWLRLVLNLTGRDGLVNLLSRLMPQVNAEAKFFVRLALATIRRNDVLIYSPTLSAEGVRFPGLEIYDNLPAVWDRAGQLLAARRRTRNNGGAAGAAPGVAVFTHGGVCYPLLAEEPLPG